MLEFSQQMAIGTATRADADRLRQLARQFNASMGKGGRAFRSEKFRTVLTQQPSFLGFAFGVFAAEGYSSIVISAERKYGETLRMGIGHGRNPTVLFHIWDKLGGNIGHLQPFSQRTTREDGNYRALEITGKAQVRTFVEVMQGAQHGSFPEAQRPWCLFKALKAKTLELIFRTGRYRLDGQWFSLRKGRQLCGEEGGSQGWRPFCPIMVPTYEH